MKKLPIIAAIVAALVSGCCKTNDASNVDDPWTGHGCDVCTKVVEIENHRYVLLDGNYAAGIVHAESCPCRAK